MMRHNTVSSIREYFNLALRSEDFVIDKTGVKTLELAGAQFIADEPSIFGTVNTDYVARELEWYKSQSLSVHDIPGGAPEIWKQVADEHGYINSNYGWCIYSQENGNQYENVLKELQQNPNSRRAVMIYTRPFMHYDYKFLGMNDFMCTNTVQYLIRYDRLHAIVNMRSNDVVFGYKNDFAWQQYVALQLCDDLALQLGNIVWNVGSLHIYSRHFHLVK
jgi:thymidylate synthase